MANLIVSQLNKPQVQAQKPDTDSSKGFDKSVIYAQNGIHAQRPKGRLVSSSIFAAPIIYAKDTAEDVVSLSNAVVNGKSDDYKLGRVNDLSLKLGSLAIAGYLFTKKNTSSKKWMEFVGFGSFFASMALWPKIFIQAPAKLLHGVDVFQEYEDSQGRRKKFFQDPQYIPWDIMTPEQMNKMGDRLNVPRNIKNRSDITKEKAHKIALQSNTMWMLSAGFGVPVMSAFICSGIEKYMPEWLAKSKAKKAEKAVANLIEQGFDEIKPNRETTKVFEQFVSNIGDKVVVNDKFMKNFADAITGNPEYSKTVLEELSTMPEFSAKRTLRAGFVDDMFDEFDEAFKALGVDKEKFAANYAKYSNLPESKQGFAVIKALKESGSKKAQRNNFEFVTEYIRTKGGFSSEGLSSETIEYARKLNGIFARISTATTTLSENLGQKSAATAEAAATKHWQKFSNALVKAMDLSPEQIKMVTTSDAGSEKLIAETLTQMFKDNSVYEKHFGSLFGAMGNFAQDLGLHIVQRRGFKSGNEPISMISALSEDKTNIQKVYDSIASELKEMRLPKTASLFTMGLSEGDISKSASAAMKSVDIPTQAKFSAFSRSLLTFDFFKRKSDGALIPQIKNIAGRFAHSEISDEMAGKLAKEAENVLLKGELGDYITKFSTTGDSGLNYRVIMNLLYDSENLSQSTKAILAKETSKDGLNNVSMFKTFMRNMYDTVGNLFNPHFPKIHTDAISLEQYSNNASMNIKPSVSMSFVGDSLPSMLRKTCDNITNTRLWINKFAKLGIAVAAITVASQFFFGRLNRDVKIQPQERKAA